MFLRDISIRQTILAEKFARRMYLVRKYLVNSRGNAENLLSVTCTILRPKFRWRSAKRVERQMSTRVTLRFQQTSHVRRTFSKTSENVTELALFQGFIVINQITLSCHNKLYE